MSEPILNPTVEKEFKKWEQENPRQAYNLKLTASKPNAVDLHAHLSQYSGVALRLWWLCNIRYPKWKHSYFIGKALGEYFAKYLELSAEEFERLLKPTPSLTQLEKMVKDYCKIVKREVNKDILAVIYYDWEKERDKVHRVKVFLENTFKIGYSDMIKHDLEKIRELQAKIHYGLFGEILDLYSDFSRGWLSRAYHDKKFRRKLDNLTKILSKAEQIATEIKLSVESYLKGRT